MLATQSVAVVRATLPAVGAAIEDISGLFYEQLFAAHPELLRDLFNRGNQAASTQRQALAVPSPRSPRIWWSGAPARPARRDAPTHRAQVRPLGVRPDQYPVVHRHLFAAIAQVLGDAVTPEMPAPGTRCTG